MTASQIERKTLEAGNDEFRRSYYFSPLKASDWRTQQGGGSGVLGGGGFGGGKSMSKSSSSPASGYLGRRGDADYGRTRRLGAEKEAVGGMASVLSDDVVDDERFANASRGSYTSALLARKKERRKVGGGAAGQGAARQAHAPPLAPFFSPVKPARQKMRQSASTPNLRAPPPSASFPLPSLGLRSPPPPTFHHTVLTPPSSKGRGEAEVHPHEASAALPVDDPQPLKGPSSLSAIGTHEQRPRGFKRMGADFGGAGGVFISRESAAYIM